MTLTEKAALLAGVDDWNIRGVERLGIRGVQVADCGHGVTLVGDNSQPATCFPTGIGMASTWNVELLERAGRVLGNETRACGCSILLGPKINLHRMPLNGRSFETFSEDPWLAGVLGAAVIRGIQAVGVGACLKAMAANNQQQDQEKVSSEVDERTLRELYLRAFEVAARLGEPCGIMTSYNRLNGDFAAENAWLIKKIIKNEWGFPGFVVSDWRAVHTAKVYASGLDLEMPGPGKFLHAAGVRNALQKTWLTEAEVDDKAGRITRVLLKYGQSNDPGALNTLEHQQMAREVAEESLVLLKNDNDFLPWDPATLGSVLVVGPNGAAARLGGGGSASVTPPYSVSPLEGLREILGERVQFVEGCGIAGTMESVSDAFHHQDESGAEHPGLLAEFFNSRTVEGDAAVTWQVPQVDFSWGWASPGEGIRRGDFSVRFSGTLTPPVSGQFRFGAHAQEGCIQVRIDGELVVDEWDDPGSDNFEARFQNHYLTFERVLSAGEPVSIEIAYAKRAARAGVRLEWEIPGALDPIRKAAELAREADCVLLCVGLSNLLEGGAHDRTTMDLPAVQTELIEAVTAANSRCAIAVFNGGPVLMPWADQAKALIEAWYPGQEGGRALAQILCGLTNPSGRLPDTIPFRQEDHAAMRNYPGDGEVVRYEEGLSVGYRHFDTAQIQPHFPFGFGLSYTTFNISEPALSQSSLEVGEVLMVTVEIENTGPRPGKEVVQLYLAQPDSALPRPPRELRAFNKVELGVGKKTFVTFVLGAMELESFDPESGVWSVAPGRYEVLVGPHSRALKGAALVIR